MMRQMLIKISWQLVHPKKRQILVFIPIHATDYILINRLESSSPNVKDLNIKLINTKGDIILNQNVQVDSSSYRLDLSQKPQPGCYFIQLSGNGINQTSKAISI